MTRAETIERAAQAWTPMGAATHAYDAALIAGLQLAVEILREMASEPPEDGPPGIADDTMINYKLSAKSIRAEITKLKGAKGK